MSLADGKLAVLKAKNLVLKSVGINLMGSRYILLQLEAATVLGWSGEPLRLSSV